MLAHTCHVKRLAIVPKTTWCSAAGVAEKAPKIPDSLRKPGISKRELVGLNKPQKYRDKPVLGSCTVSK
jgi:hypothetical protein